MNVLLVEPFLTGSHQAWAEGLAAHSAHDVRLVSHDGSFWKWRMQGGAPTLAAEVRAEVGDWGRPDVLLVSDMVHVPALVGLARDVLATVPVVLYMHENQLTYPLPDDAAPDYAYAIVNWLSMAAADCVVFNSEYHRRSWFDALPRLLRRFPDYRHTAGVEAVESRSAVLPVGIDSHRLAGARDTEAAPPLVLWNHRWEYDKNPRAFFAALSAVAGRGVDFRVAIAGQQFQTVPDDFAAARQAFGDRVVQFGTLDRAAYEDLLRQSDVVVSTALHEFFGLSVLEAVAAGACPVLPNRLSYTELFPPDGLYDDDAGVVGLVDRLCRLLTDDDARRAQAASAHARAVEYDWSLVAPRYDALLSAISTGTVPVEMAEGRRLGG